MMKIFKARQTCLLFILLLSVFLITGCGGGGETGHWVASPATQLVSITVTPATATVDMPTGAPQQYIAIATYSDGTSRDVTASATWTSGTTGVATVNSTSGLSTAVGNGTSVITAAFGGKSGSGNLTVTTATLSSITVTPATASIPSGLTQRFVATGTFTDGRTLDISSIATWSSGTIAVATVVSPGVATGQSAGTALITATSGGKSGSAALTVTAATLVSIAVTPATASVPMGLTQRFIATGTFTDGTTLDISDSVTWSSGTLAVATIVSPGNATGRSIGAATITATLGGKSGSGTLTVTAATLSSIAVTPATASIPMGLKQPFVATGTFTDGTTVDISTAVTWTSGNTPVATVLSPGVATGRSAGTATITAALGGKSGSAALTVTAATLVSIAVTPATATVPIGLTQPFVATGTFTDGTTVNISSTVLWTSGSPLVATVLSTTGVATGVSAGTATITATSGGKSGSATVTVPAATLVSIAVTPATASVPIGLTQPFVATGTFTDGTTVNISSTVLWTSGSPLVATVLSTTGVATGVSAGTATITATSGGKSGSATVTVPAATLVSIAVTPLTASVPMGLTQRFVATGAFSDGTSADISTTVTWTSGSPLVATVVSPGVATGVSAGTATITATSGGKSGSATLTVTAATLSSIGVTPLTASVPMGLTQRFVATGAFSDGTSVDISSTVSWTSGSPLVATVVSPGVATGVSVGAATITATSGGKSGSATLTVTAATLSSIAVTPLTASVPMGLTQRFVATGAFSDGTSVDISSTVTWTSGSPLVATVVSPGVATGLSVGTATITATSGTTSGSATLTVTAATLSSIAVTPVTASIPTGGTQAFVARGVFSDGSIVDISTTVTWSSGTIVVATVLPTGVATGLSGGTATITATSGTKSGSGTLTVVPAATLSSIAVTPLTALVAIGGTQTFVANGTFSDGSIVDISTTVTWTSNNLPVATVVSPGVATGLSAGTATITATSGAKSGAATLTVPAATLSSIAVTPATPTIPSGGTQTFVANGTFSDGSIVNISNTVTWTSNNLPVATVVSPGVATGLAGGTATITATSGATSGAATLTVTAALGPDPVPLATAGDFVILTKAGITNGLAATLAISGNIGTSPITAAALNTIPCTGIVAGTGAIFGVDAGYTGGACYSATAANKTKVDNAVLDLGLAIDNAKGRITPDFTELGAGDISGLVLVPGLYKWGTGVLITSAGVTLTGGPNDVWIFQIAQDLTVNNSAIVTLAGGALPKNIFWQVSGQATLGTAADFKGIILSETLVSLNTTAVVNGRLFGQTEVTLQGNTVTQPAP